MQIYVILIACVVLLLCLFFKVPVFISVFAGALVYFLLGASSSPAILAQRIISGTQSIPLLAIPFFICAGVFMNYTGVTKRIMNFCNALTKRMTGGLGQVNVLLSTLMGGLSGSNLADAAMEAKMLVPEMEKAGYSKEFSSNLSDDHSVNSTWNRYDSVWLHCKCINWKIICCRDWHWYSVMCIPYDPCVDHLEKERISGCTEGTEAERGIGKIFPAGGITAMSPDHYHRRNQDRCSDADGSRNSGNRLCAASRSCLP